MLELNKWFFVLLLNFLVLLYVLNIILFKPFLKLFKDRGDFVKDSLAAAKELDTRKNDAVSEITRELQGARNRSREIFENIRAEGLARQKEILEAAHNQSHELIEKAKQELTSEAEKARQTLRSTVDRFSDDIVRKLIGMQ